MNACKMPRYQPNMKKIIDDIFVLSIPPSLRIQPVNCYLIKGDNGFTIADTGVNDEISKKTWQELINLGLDIEKVVLTHRPYWSCSLVSRKISLFRLPFKSPI